MSEQHKKEERQEADLVSTLAQKDSVSKVAQDSIAAPKVAGSAEGEAESLVYRLKARAAIRRSVKTRKSVQEGKPDRISDLLEEAAERISTLERELGEARDNAAKWERSYQELRPHYEAEWGAAMRLTAERDSLRERVAFLEKERKG